MSVSALSEKAQNLLRQIGDGGCPDLRCPAVIPQWPVVANQIGAFVPDALSCL